MNEPAPERTSPGRDDSQVRSRVLFRRGLYTSLGVLATAAAAAAVYGARAVLIRVLIALFLAISLDPAVRLLTRRGIRRGLAVALVVLVALGLIAGTMLSIIPALVEQSRTLVENLPANAASLQDRWPSLRQVSDRFNLGERVEGVLSSLPERISSGAFEFTGRVASTVASILTIAVVAVYFMVDLPRVRRSVVLLFPRAYRPEVDRIADVMVDKVGGYMIGNIATSLIAGVASFVAFTVIGVPFALPLAFVVAVTDLIPLIGATIGAVVCVLVTLATAGLWPDAVLVAVFLVLYQQLENYVISPRIMRRPIQLSPGAILLASLIGAGTLGLIGALMAIPFAAGINVLLSERLEVRDATDSGATAPTDSDGHPAN